MNDGFSTLELFQPIISYQNMKNIYIIWYLNFSPEFLPIFSWLFQINFATIL